MDDRRKIQAQRCFKVPRNRLDQFLVAVYMQGGPMTMIEASYIFENGGNYDVVVTAMGPDGMGGGSFELGKLKEFANELCAQEYKE